MKSIIFLFFFIYFTSSFSQEITGIVLDQKTNQPIETVAIYFDNTTKGVLTNKKGLFSIDYKEGIKTPLVVSFLGYKKILFEDYEPNKHYKFLLEEEESTLDEVVLVSKDEWSRERKLHHFKTQFLGLTENGQSCTIINEDDIHLSFSKKHKKLIATSRKPIIIISNNLGYKIKYDLQGFEIDYSVVYIDRLDSTTKPYPRYSIKSVYYSGTSLFSNLNDDIDKKTRKVRNKSYYGSVLHFMRAMAKNELNKEGFKIISGNFKVKPEKFILVSKSESEHAVEVELIKRLDILYKGKQSFIEPVSGKFTIDALGNYSPVESLSFGGEMGKNRIGDTLPLDYNFTD